MLSKRFWLLMVLWLVLLEGCDGLPGAQQPDTLSAQEDRSPGMSTEPEVETANQTETARSSPTATSIWDDRAIFTQNLSQSGLPLLDDLPLASVYRITLDIPKDLTEPMAGSLTVRYFNTEGEVLEAVYFRLFPNYYGGLLEVRNVMVDGQPAATELENVTTALRVDLAEPLDPGSGVEISMDYRLTLPLSMGGNYGLLGYFDDVLVLDTFYPMIPAYDESGWAAQYPFPNGDLTYNDASFYLVEVSAPADLLLAASGTVVEENSRDGKQHLTLAAGPARDFYLAGSRSFTVKSQDKDGVLVNSYALDGFQEYQQAALESARQAINTFSDLFGPYPYREFDMVSSPMLALGIEYPGITGILWELYKPGGMTRGVPNEVMLESVIVHEVGHQWFYNVVGNDQQRQPWLDEALVQYITYVYFLENYGENAAREFPLSWQLRMAGIEDTSLPIGLAAGAYEGPEYSAIVYGKGPSFFLALEDQIGRQVLWDGIARYYQANQWSQPGPEDLQTSLEEACGCDLSLRFKTWVYPGEPDQP